MIAVIGASSSGLYAAWRLAQAGHQVELYEKTSDLQFSPRRLIVTSALAQLLSLSHELVLHYVNAFEFFAVGNTGYVRLKNPDLIIERTDLIAWLAEKARASGVHIQKGWAFSGLASENGQGAVVTLRHSATGKHKAIHPTVLIGADGALSAVREALGPGYRLPTVALLQAKILLPLGHPPDLVQIWFKKEMTPYFYWLVPDSSLTGIVGVIVDEVDGQKAQHALDSFINHMGWKALDYEGGYTTLYVPSFRPEARRDGLRICLVGDAAGQVKTTTVGGTVAGLRGAAACARAITQDTPYERELAPLRRELRVHALIRRFLNPLDDKRYGKILSSVDGNGALLGKFSRDEVSPHLIPLLIKNPRFSLRIAKAVMKRGNREA
jgi:flavin-dependent dehydrogenase